MNGTMKVIMCFKNCLLYLQQLYLLIFLCTNRNINDILCCNFLFVDTRLLNKWLILFGMNGVLLHTFNRSSLQNKALSRNLDIITRTNIYFIHPRFRDFF